MLLRCDMKEDMWTVVNTFVTTTSMNMSNMCDSQLYESLRSRTRSRRSFLHLLNLYVLRPFAGHGTAHVAASNMLVAQPGDALDMESLTVMGQIPRRWTKIPEMISSWIHSMKRECKYWS